MELIGTYSGRVFANSENILFYLERMDSPPFSKLVHERIPYHQRLYIIRFLYFRKRFRVRVDGMYQGTFHNQRKLSSSDYIKTLYGYFKEDPFRKPFLIHQKISYIFTMLYEPFSMNKYIPRKQLRTLVLDGSPNFVSFEGIDYLPIYDLVITGKSNKETFSKLIKVSPELKTLFYYRNFTFTDDEETLNKIRNLKGLKFRTPPTTNDFKTIFLKPCKISHLRLSIPSFLETSHLQNLYNLEHLSFNNSKSVIRDEEAKEVIKNLPNLRHLELNYTDLTLDGFIYILKNHKNLKKLFANFTKLDTSLDWQAFDRNETMDFSTNRNKIQEIQIQGTVFTNDLIDVLVHSSSGSLKSLDISRCDFSRLEADNGKILNFLLNFKDLKKMVIFDLTEPELPITLDQMTWIQSLVIKGDDGNTCFYINENLRYLEIGFFLEPEHQAMLIKRGIGLVSIAARTENYDAKGPEELVKFVDEKMPKIIEFQYRWENVVSRENEFKWSRKFNM